MVFYNRSNQEDILNGLQNIIMNKSSVRDYKEKKVDEKIILELSRYANTCPRLAEDIEMDIRIMDNDVVYRQLDGFAGYHGIMINAPHYVILLSEKKDHYMENAGYVGESIAMKAFDLGVDPAGSHLQTVRK